MALFSPAFAEFLRDRIRQCNLPRPLNIFLFGFDPVRPEQEQLPAPAPKGPVKVEAPRRRGPKPGASRISYDEIRARLDTWVAEQKDFPDEFNLDDLAMNTSLYKTHLLKYFRYCEKKDFRYWKMEKKIEKARQMLLDDPDRPVTEISVRCGFNNSSNFFRQFKRLTGCTPLQWRERDLENGQFPVLHHEEDNPGIGSRL